VMAKNVVVYLYLQDPEPVAQATVL
jgi:hypothetical protein